MKRFAFSLERVLALRREQAQIEELKLEQILNRRRQLERLAEQRRRSLEQESATLLARRDLSPVELDALVSYRHWTAAQCGEIAAHAAACDREADGQRTRIREARQRQRLVEELRERRVSEWEAAFARELDELAAESYLARWNRERRLAAWGTNARPNPEPAPNHRP